jgi:hypothetical protein
MSPCARKERRGEEAAFPNLLVQGGDPIFDYLQRGEYLAR